LLRKKPDAYSYFTIDEQRIPEKGTDDRLFSCINAEKFIFFVENGEKK